MTDTEQFKQIIDSMYELYKRKNANYGNSFTKLWNDLGPISGLVPLHNKLDRLTNLVKGGKNDFESIEDTLVDLANYAIMNVIEMKRSQAPTLTKEPQQDFISQTSSGRKSKKIINENS